MLQRYLEIRQYISKIAIPAIVKTEKNEVELLCSKLADLDSVTKALQREDITLHETRVLFNSIIEEYPETRDRLAPDSSLVLNPDFENAIVRIQSGRMS